MDPADIGFLKAVVAFVVVAGTSITVLRMWLRVRYQPRPASDEVVDALRDENAQLRADLEMRMTELEERVDFTERRLVQDGSQIRLPGPTAHTPV